MTLIEVLTAADEHIVGLAPYTWQCFGTTPVFMALGTETEDWASVVFDTETMAVYAMEVQSPGEPAILRWIDPDWQEAWLNESRDQGIDILVSDGLAVLDSSEQQCLAALNTLKELAQ